MKKWELISEAYQRFPKGTRFKNMLRNEIIESSGIFEIHNAIIGNGFWIRDSVKAILYHSDKGWATIVTEPEKIAVKVETRKPIWVSEDGVDLFEDDDCAWVIKISTGWNYCYNMCIHKGHTKDLLTKKEDYRLFSNKELALDWVKKQSITIKLNEDVIATIDKNRSLVVLDSQLGISNIALDFDSVQKLAEALK